MKFIQLLYVSLLSLIGWALPNLGHSQTYHFSVPASPLWVDTGVSLSAGEQVALTASGSWEFGLGPVSPAGIPYYQSWDRFLAGDNQGELLAYVGSDPYQGHWGDGNFFPQAGGYWGVGSGGQFTSASTGELWLGINDDAVSQSVGDNSGAISVQMTVAADRTPCTPPPPGLVAWWKAETNALDSAGTNDGLLQPGVDFSAGKVGQAFHFNGDTNSFIEVPDSPALELTNELTIEFWVKRLRLSFDSWPYADYIVEKGGDWTGGMQNYAVALHNPSYNYCLHFCFAGGWRGGGSVADTNSWHHCAVVARNGDANPTFYIDGVPQPVAYSEGAYTINLYPSTRPLHIGALLDDVTGWHYYSDTLVDELSIYSRALSAREIQAIYHAGSAGKCDPLNATAPTGSITNCIRGSTNVLWDFSVLTNELQSLNLDIQRIFKLKTNAFQVQCNAPFTQDGKGKLAGAGTTTVTLLQAKNQRAYTNTFTGDYAARGAVTSSKGVAHLNFSSQVAGKAVLAGYPIASPISVRLNEAVKLDANNNLISGRSVQQVFAWGQCVMAETDAIGPSPMFPALAAELGDGTWTLVLNFGAANGNKLSGTATATLNSGQVYHFNFTGIHTPTTGQSKLNLSGTGAGNGSNLQITLYRSEILRVVGQVAGQAVNIK